MARATREALLLCEAAGHDIIIVETVGVGQSETTVHGLVDFFLLLLLAGAGDELQGVKRGIMEMADALCITKADHGNEQAARRARVDYLSALHLFPARAVGAGRCRCCSPRLWPAPASPRCGKPLKAYAAATRASGYFAQRRQQQQLQWLHQSVAQALESRFYADPAVRARLPAVQAAVAAGQLTPWAAAEELLGS